MEGDGFVERAMPALAGRRTVKLVGLLRNRGFAQALRGTAPFGRLNVY